MNFWASSLYTMGGSLSWEYFGEQFPPATNDLIMTTTGGMFLGETLYRFSDLLLDDRASGTERVFREIGAALLNPVRGFNRLVLGRSTNRSPTRNHIREPLAGFVFLGRRGIAESDNATKVDPGPVFRLWLLYGRPVRDGARRPFDFVDFEFWIKSGAGRPYFSIFANALLAGKTLYFSGRPHHTLGLFQQFDFIRNEVIEISGSTFAAGLRSRVNVGKRIIMNSTAQVGWMIMGAYDNEYVSIDQRDYNYGSGLNYKVHSALTHDKFGTATFNYSHYLIYSFQGADGHDELDVLFARYHLPIWKNFGIGGEYFMYLRNGHYRDFPDVRREYHGIRLMFSYDIGEL